MNIPLEWIRKYVDQIIEVAGRMPEGKLRDALLLRADNVMDLVKAWKDSNKGGS